MPFKKSNKLVKYKRKGRKKNTLSNKLNKLSKFVYKTIETKYINRSFTQNGSQLLNAVDWKVYPLTDIPSGTGATDDERIGDKVTVTNISADLYFKRLTGTDFIRIIIVQWADLDNYIASLDVPLILQHTVTSPTGDNMEPILSQYKVGSAARFKILYDRVLHPQDQKQFQINQGGSVNANRILHIRNKDLKKYSDQLGFLTGANQSRPIKNGVAMYLFCNSDQLITTDTPEVFMSNRMKYKDA